MNELQQYRNEIAPDDAIDVEFTVEADDWRGQPSGFFCKRCETASLTGDKSCRNCGLKFAIPTIPLEGVKGVLVDWMPLMNPERWSADQLRWLNEQRKKRR